MGHKELPPLSYDEKGNSISYVFDSKTNEYIDIREYQSDKEKLSDLIRLFEERSMAGINRRIIKPITTKAQ